MKCGKKEKFSLPDKNTKGSRNLNLQQGELSQLSKRLEKQVKELQQLRSKYTI